MSQLLAYFYSNAALTSATEHAAPKKIDGPLRLFAGGSMDGRKGVALALHALARAKTRGLKFSYRFGGKGPEFNGIQQLAAKLGLQDEVRLGNPLTGQAYKDELQAAHVYLLPSLRDSAGITLAEAMLAGCVPVVADCGGPGQIVTGECGFKVAATTPNALIEELSGILLRLDQNRNLILEKGAAAARRIATGFSEEHYRATINGVYQSVCAAPRGVN